MKAGLLFVSLVLIGCARFGHTSPSYARTEASALIVLNFTGRPARFEFRVDGVQLIDTTVAAGGLPPVVLARVLRLTPGKHRLELYDARTGQYHVQDFKVRASDMTIELRFFLDSANVRTYYSRVLYM